MLPVPPHRSSVIGRGFLPSRPSLAQHTQCRTQEQQCDSAANEDIWPCRCGRRDQTSGGENAEIGDHVVARALERSEEHTSELQSLMRISYAVFFFKKNKN